MAGFAVNILVTNYDCHYGILQYIWNNWNWNIIIAGK